MKKAEIEFLHSAGFTLEEIMAMYPVQNDENGKAAPAGSTPTAEQNAQKAETAQTPAASDPAQTPPAPASAQTLNADPQTVILDKLDKLIAAVQAGNRSGASVQTPEKKTPEEIAGQLY